MKQVASRAISLPEGWVYIRNSKELQHNLSVLIGSLTEKNVLGMHENSPVPTSAFTDFGEPSTVKQPIFKDMSRMGGYNNGVLCFAIQNL
jgi:hypothetical protein